MELLENLGDHISFASNYIKDRLISEVNKPASLYYLQPFKNNPELDEEIYVSGTFLVHSVGNQLRASMNFDKGWGDIKEVFWIDLPLGTTTGLDHDSNLIRSLCIFFDNLIHIFADGESFLVHLPFSFCRAWPLKNSILLKSQNVSCENTEAEFYLFEHPLEGTKNIILDSGSSSDDFFSLLISSKIQIVQVFNETHSYILTYNIISKCHTLWEYINHSSFYNSKNKKVKLSNPKDFFLNEFKNNSTELDYKNIVVNFKNIWTEPFSQKGPCALKSYFLKRLHDQLVLCILKENHSVKIYAIFDKSLTSPLFETTALDIIPISTIHPEQHDIIILSTDYLFVWIGEPTLINLKWPFTKHDISKLDYSRQSRFNVYCNFSRSWKKLKVKGVFYSTLVRNCFELISLVTPLSFLSRLHETLLLKHMLQDWPRFVISLLSLIIKPTKSLKNEHHINISLNDKNTLLQKLKRMNLSNLIIFCSEASEFASNQDIDIKTISNIVMILQFLYQEYRLLNLNKNESHDLSYLLGLLTISHGGEVFHDYYFLDAPNTLLFELKKYFDHIVFEPPLLEFLCIYRLIYKYIINGFVSHYCPIKEVQILRDRLCKFSSLEIEVSLKKVIPNLIKICDFLKRTPKTNFPLDKTQLSTLDPCLQIILGDMINNSIKEKCSILTEKYQNQSDKCKDILDSSQCLKLSQKAKLVCHHWAINCSITFPLNLSGKVVDGTYIPSEGIGKLWESSQCGKFIDYRFKEAENLLTSFKEDCVIQDQTINSENKKALINEHASFTEGLVCGRFFGLGIFRFRTLTTTIIDPKNWLSVHGEFLVDEDSFVIKVDESIPWIQFHQGVLTALQHVSIAPSCLLPRAELTGHRIGGYLFGLGLAGRLQDLTDLALLQGIIPNDPPSTAGMLLGKAAANFATCDQKASSLFKVKIKTISVESVVSLLGIGLVNFSSCDGQLINLVLDHICSKDISGLKQSADFAEAMAIAAGFSLGFIGFGKGPDLANLSSIFSTLSTKPNSYAVLIALALLFFDTDHPNAVKVLSPLQDDDSSIPSFNEPEIENHPFSYFIRMICLNFVQWKKVPSILDASPDISVNQMGLSYFVNIAANCFSIGLYYMGSYHQPALAYVKKLSDKIRYAVDNSTSLSIRSVYNTLLISSHLAMAMIMAGSADLLVLQHLRLFQRRREPGVNYGHVSGNSMAIGLLFCGEGRFCLPLGNGPQLALAFLAFFPLFSPSPHEDFSPFPQMFRHFWAMCLKLKPENPPLLTLSRLASDPSHEKNSGVKPSKKPSETTKYTSFFNPDIYSTYFPGLKDMCFKGVYAPTKLQQLALLNIYLPYAQNFPLSFKNHIVSLYQKWKNNLDLELNNLTSDLKDKDFGTNSPFKLSISKYRSLHFLPSFNIGTENNISRTNLHSIINMNGDFNEFIDSPLPPYS